MLLPLVLLAILSVTGGFLGVPAVFHGANHFEHFLDPVFAKPELTTDVLTTSSLELTLAAVSVSVALLGFLVAWFMYYRKPGTASALAKRLSPIYSIVAHKFYVDELYHALFVTGLGAFSTGVLYHLIDAFSIDGTGKFATWIAQDLGEATRRIQSGNLRSYAGWLALGAACVMAVMIFGRTLYLHH